MDEISEALPRLKVAFIGWCSEPGGRVTVACSAYDDFDRNWEVAVNSSDRATAMRALKAAGLHGLSKTRTSQFQPADDLRTLASATMDEVVFVPRETH